MCKRHLVAVGVLSALTPWLAGCGRDASEAVGQPEHAALNGRKSPCSCAWKCRRRRLRRGCFLAPSATTRRSWPPTRHAGRLVDAHDDIVLRHDEEHRWCLDCHDAANRDRLHLASGELVPFEELYRVCGQCHGEKYRDWRAGVHGRRIGEWNGTKGVLIVRALPQSASAALQSARAEASAATAPAIEQIETGDLDGERSDDLHRALPAGSSRPWPRRRPRVGFSPPAVLGACMKFRETGCARRSSDVGARLLGKYGKAVTVSDAGPMPGVLFAFALDLSRCNGNRLCVDACVAENNQSRDPEVQWIRVLSMNKEKGDRFLRCRSVLRAEGSPGAKPVLRADGLPTLPERAVHEGLSHRGHLDRARRHRSHRLRLVHRLPVLHGRLSVWRTPLQLGVPSVPQVELNPSMHYLGNRPRPKGVVEKCSFCIQRVRAGRYPACLEPARPEPANSATCSIPRARFVTSSTTNGCCCSSRS